ncbi:hypothetical protein ABZP36_025514 [Zizania latifolia]
MAGGGGAAAVEESPLGSARWSPEAEIGMRAEDIWDSLDKPIGSIMIKDVKHLLTASEPSSECRTLTAKEFIANARQSSGERQMNIITCKREDSVKDIILKLDAEKRQRIYVVDEQGNLDGLITLRDIIAKLVYEPPGYLFRGLLQWCHPSTSEQQGVNSQNQNVSSPNQVNSFL